MRAHAVIADHTGQGFISISAQAQGETDGCTQEAGSFDLAGARKERPGACAKQAAGLSSPLFEDEESIMPNSVAGASPVLLLDYWKPVKGFEGFYEVSCTGSIRRVGKVKPLVGAITRKGYRMVLLHRPGRKWTASVHGIIATHFVGERPEGLLVNHKDGVKLNNRASNFEYTTSLENTRHAMRIGTYKPGTYQSGLDEQDVSNIRELLSLGLYTTEISSLYAIDNSAVSRIRNGKFKTRPKEPISGRDIYVSGHHRVQLTAADVMEIRRLRPATSLKELAQRFGVSLGVICDAALGNTWSHLPGARPKGEAKSGPHPAAPSAAA